MLILIAVILITFFVLLRYFVIDKLIIKDVGSKAILITGAGAGFGKALVQKCLEEGMTVFAGCRVQQSVDKLIEECKNKKGDLKAFQMDVTSQQSVDEAKAYVKEQLKAANKELYALVNNAGIQGASMYDDFLIVDDYKETMEVNMFGAVRVTHAFKQLIKHSKGRIIFCTSACVRFPSPSLAPYAASKWATTAYADVLRNELYPFGVTVSVLEPGVFRTPLNHIPRVMEIVNKIWDRASQETRDEYGYYWFNKGKRFYIKMIEGASFDLGAVTEAYFHAIAAKYPHLNYCVGYDAVLVFRPYSWLPPQLQLWIMKIFMRIAGVGVPAAVDTNEY